MSELTEMLVRLRDRQPVTEDEVVKMYAKHEEQRRYDEPLSWPRYDHGHWNERWGENLPPVPKDWRKK